MGERYREVIEGVAIAALLGADFSHRGEARKVALERVNALAGMKRKSRVAEPDNGERPPLPPGKM